MNLVIVQCEYFGEKYMHSEMPEKLQELAYNPQVQELAVSWKMELEESEEEFNDMGIMQALDVVTACLYVLEQVEIINTNRIMIFGHSHGAYIAHLANVICPDLFSYILDISGYLIPYYMNKERMVGYSIGDNKNVHTIFNYLVSEKPSMQYDKELYDLRYLYNQFENRCRILAIQGVHDWMFDYREKVAFLKNIPYGDVILVTEDDVDGVVFKNTNHGCGLDFIQFLGVMIPIIDKKIEVNNALVINDDIYIADELWISYKTNRPIVKYLRNKRDV